MDRPYNVLFLCTGNSARSIMAEAILNKLGAGQIPRLSAPAASPKARCNPHTVQLLQSLGYDTSRLPLEVVGRVCQARRAERSISCSRSATTRRARPARSGRANR